MFLEQLPGLIESGKKLILPTYLGWSGHQVFEKIAPGSGVQGALTGVVLSQLSETRLAQSEVAGATIAAAMAGLGILGMPGSEPIETVAKASVPLLEGASNIIYPDPTGDGIETAAMLGNAIRDWWDSLWQ